MAERTPFVPKEPGDTLKADDWNAAQIAAREAIASHRHGIDAPGLSAAAVTGGGDWRFHSTTVEELTIAGVPPAELPTALLGAGATSTPLDAALQAGDHVTGDLRIEGDLHIRGDLKVGGDLALTDSSIGGAGVRTYNSGGLHQSPDRPTQAGRDLLVPVMRPSTLLLLLRGTRTPEVAMTYNWSNPFYGAESSSPCLITVLVQHDGKWFAVQPRFPQKVDSTQWEEVVPLSLQTLESRMPTYTRENRYEIADSWDTGTWQWNITDDSLDLDVIGGLARTHQEASPVLKSANSQVTAPLQLVRPLDVPAGDYVFRIYGRCAEAWRITLQVIVIPH